MIEQRFAAGFENLLVLTRMWCCVSYRHILRPPFLQVSLPFRNYLSLSQVAISHPHHLQHRSRLVVQKKHQDLEWMLFRSSIHRLLRVEREWIYCSTVEDHICILRWIDSAGPLRSARMTLRCLYRSSRTQFIFCMFRDALTGGV